MSKWKPIETAPKGKRILLSHRTEVYLGCWYDKFESLEWDEEKDEQIYRGAWTDFTVAHWGYEEYVEIEPTHWMEAPEPSKRKL